MEIELNAKKRKRGGRFFFFVLVVVCVSICVVVSHLFASVITTGNLSFSAVSIASTSTYKFYAVSISNFTSKTQAEENANDIHAKNAGGFVFLQSGKYYVLASIYQNKNDAESVATNLSTLSYTPEVIEISFEKANFSNCSSGNLKNNYLQFLDEFKLAYQKLYDISVSLDTSVFSETKSRIEIDAIKTNFKNKMEELSSGTSSNDGVYFATLKRYAGKIENSLSELVEYESTQNYPLSAKIKYVYMDIINSLKELSESLVQK